jgi:hypothetical protein
MPSSKLRQTLFFSPCDLRRESVSSTSARLGWEPGFLNGNGDKPKWMRWRTFERLAAEHDQFVTQSLRAAALKFGLPIRDFLG